MNVTVTGVAQARAYFSRLKDGAEAMGKLVILVGSHLRYARYQHEGTRSFRGTFYLSRAAQAAMPFMREQFTQALPKGPAAVFAAGMASGHAVQARAIPLARIRTGNLRGSIAVYPGRRRA